VYRGRSDLHDQRFNHMRTTTTTTELKARVLQHTKYSGVAFDDSYCPFTAKIYPTIDMENQYLTKRPIYFTLGVFLIFVFTSIVFSFYDCNVERRQMIVLDSAVKSAAIVSSLYPSVVREKLIMEQTETSNSHRDIMESFRPNRDKRTFFGTIGGKFDIKAPTEKDPKSVNADLYPDTTIFFGKQTQQNLLLVYKRLHS
jgi:hypothetical protein